MPGYHDASCIVTPYWLVYGLLRCIYSIRRYAASPHSLNCVRARQYSRTMRLSKFADCILYSTKHGTRVQSLKELLGKKQATDTPFQPLQNLSDCLLLTQAY
jgi:hypothetical protein